MTSPSVAALAKAVVDDGYRSVSTGVTPLDPALFGATNGFIVRDPDGHAVQFIDHTTSSLGHQP